MAGFVFKDYSDVVFKRMNSNCDSTMQEVGEKLVEKVQEKMLYAYYKEVVDTGALFDSIKAEQRKVSQNTFTVEVGSGKHYAGYVHEGTSRMRGRPYIRDGVMDAQDDIRTIMESGLSNGFK